jgi:phosphoenolpyruvate carboxylase
MNLVLRLARVSKGLQRAALPALPSPRVTRLLALAVTLLLLAHPTYAQKRREAILQLRDDVSTAMAHATLTEKQTQKLDHCRQTLLLAAQSGKLRKAATKRDLDGEGYRENRRRRSVSS